MKNDEAKIQVSICQWLQENGYWFFAVNNEAHGRSAVQHMQMISMGLRAGASDLVIVLPGGKSMFIEVKDIKGKQSESQVKFQNRVEKLGHIYKIVRSVQDTVDILSIKV